MAGGCILVALARCLLACEGVRELSFLIDDFCVTFMISLSHSSFQFQIDDLDLILRLGLRI